MEGGDVESLPRPPAILTRAPQEYAWRRDSTVSSVGEEEIVTPLRLHRTQCCGFTVTEEHKMYIAMGSVLCCMGVILAAPLAALIIVMS